MILTPDREWKPLKLDDDVQWEDYDEDMRSSAKIPDTSYNQSNDTL